MSKNKIQSFVLVSPEGYFRSFHCDNIISAKGMQVVYQVILAIGKTDAMRIDGTEEFARGFAHGINILLNTQFKPIKL